MSRKTDWHQYGYVTVPKRALAHILDLYAAGDMEITETSIDAMAELTVALLHSDPGLDVYRD